MIRNSDIFPDILNEVRQIEGGKYGRPYASNHEAYAVLLEETQELFDEIKKKNPSVKHLRDEAIQCMAVLYRYINQLDNNLIEQ